MTNHFFHKVPSRLLNFGKANAKKVESQKISALYDDFFKLVCTLLLFRGDFDYFAIDGKNAVAAMMDRALSLFGW